MCVHFNEHTGLCLAFGAAAAAEPDPTRPSRSHTYMAVESPVVYFKLVDKDLHGASDLVDLQQQLGFLLFVRAFRVKKRDKKQTKKIIHGSLNAVNVRVMKEDTVQINQTKKRAF